MSQTTLRKWMKKMDIYDPYVEQLLIEEGIEDPINDFKTMTKPQWDHFYHAVFNKSELEEQFYIENKAKERLARKMRKLEKYWTTESTSPENKTHIKMLKHLQIGDRIEVKKGMFGIIKYMGPLNASNSNLKQELLGIELDNAIPNGNDGQNLFVCKKGHGYFTPRWRIKGIIKPPKEQTKKLSVLEKIEQKFEQEQKQKRMAMEQKNEKEATFEDKPLPPVPVISNAYGSRQPKDSHVPYSGSHFLDKLKKIEEAEGIISNSKEPFWGKLIKQLYDKGFLIDEIEEGFKRTNQGFKWSGQIQIWYQDTKPLCIEQLQFANGDGKPEYVKKVIQKLVEDNCRDPTPPPPVVDVPVVDASGNEKKEEEKVVEQNNTGN